MQFEASARALEALQIGDKLWVAPDDTLAVDVPWVGQPVARLISGNSRVRTLDTLRAFATNAPVSALTPKAIAGVRTLSLTYIMNGDAAIAEQLNAAADTMYARVRDAMPPVAVFDSCVASATAAAAATDTSTVTATATATATDTPAVTATAAAAATDISTVTVTAAATDTPAVTATAMAAATDTPAVTATDFMPQPCAAAGPDGGSAGGSDDDDGSDPGSDDDDGSDSDSGSDPGSDDDGATDPGAELPCTAAVAAAAPETSDERSEVTALEALPEPSPEPCACLSARPHSPLAASTYTYRRQKRYQLSYAHQGWSAEY
jgi:hypothetical protein